MKKLLATLWLIQLPLWAAAQPGGATDELLAALGSVGQTKLEKEPISWKQTVQQTLETLLQEEG